MADEVTPGFVFMKALDPGEKRKSLRLTEELGPKKPQVVSAYGGWQVTQRPRKIGLTDWVGRDPLKVAFNIMFEGSGRLPGVQTERRCRILEAMAGLDSDDPEPPLLIVDGGGGIPHDYTRASHVTWVIETLDWSEDEEIRNHAGNRTRALANVTIMQYSEEERLAGFSAAHDVRKKKRATRKKSTKSKRGSDDKSHTVKQGETLSTIAANRLGNYRRWKEIADLNNIRDPNFIKVGQKLKLP